MSKELVKKLAKIQKELKAPKGQFNSFGKYKYRNCEDILEAVKPLLGDLILTLKDEIHVPNVYVGDTSPVRHYVKATAVLTDGESSVEVSALARESETKKGMDDSQITGTASSYARKYALNGLFLIDDTKDADTDEHTAKTKPSSPVKKKGAERKPAAKAAKDPAGDRKDEAPKKSTSFNRNAKKKKAVEEEDDL